MSISKILRKKTDCLWESIFNHPFVTGIGDGSLASEKYAYYLKQDYLYLISFSKVFALASAKADAYEDMAYFANLLNLTLNVEMDLHRRTCTQFGITGDDLLAEKPSLITNAYTSFEIKTCYDGNLVDILAVLLPCAKGYVEIAQRLRQKGVPENPHYKDWIETYASEDFVEYANWLEDRLDQLTQSCSQQRMDNLFEIYQTSARYELLFFEMAWKMEFWSQAVDAE